MEKSTNLQTIDTRNPLGHTIINPTVKALASVVDNKIINNSFFISWGHFDKNGFSTIAQTGTGINMSIIRVMKNQNIFL